MYGIHTRIHISISYKYISYIYTQIYTYINAYIHICMRIYIYTGMHTYR